MLLRASLITTASPDAVLGHVAQLDDYPTWMSLVHSARREADSTPPAWNVELRARVGPLARSKRLRMVRTEYAIGDTSRIVFERSETDGRRHAAWRLEATVGPVRPAAGTAVDGRTELVMTLSYDGRFFVSVVESVLRQNVEAGRKRLAELLAT